MDMNRVDFMNQLERLLQSIAPGEREEALQYYNDYFDDAGKENEQEVIEALGNPARVAENIKRDLLGNGYGGDLVPKARPSDRALVEYGKEGAVGEGSAGEAETMGQGGSESEAAPAETGQDAGSRTVYGQYSDRGDGGGRQAFGPDSPENNGWNGADSAGAPEAYNVPPEKGGMPPWAIALLATLLVFAFPVLLGLLAVLFALVVCWYTLIFSVGAVAVALLLMLLVLVITGLICVPTNPWVGMAMVGGGLVCGGIGMLFLMLTVAMAGGVTPAIWRGIRFMFGKKKTGMRAGARREG